MEDGSLLTKHFRANLGLPSVLMCETASHFKVPLKKSSLHKKGFLKKQTVILLVTTHLPSLGYLGISLSAHKIQSKYV